MLFQVFTSLSRLRKGFVVRIGNVLQHAIDYFDNETNSFQVVTVYEKIKWYMDHESLLLLLVDDHYSCISSFC